MRLAAGLALWAGLCSPVQSQFVQVAPDVQRAFVVFDRYCVAAMQGLDALRPLVPVPGPLGEQVWSVSPDGHSIDMQTADGDFIVIVTFRYMTAVEQRDCMVQQFNALLPAEQVPVVAEAVLGHLTARAGTSVVGGLHRVEPVTPGFDVPGTPRVTVEHVNYTVADGRGPGGVILNAWVTENVVNLSSTVHAVR